MTILDPIDTEMVVLTGIMIQNLPLATRWHLRGVRRLGIVAEDVEMVQKCVEMVAEWFGVKLDKVPRAADVEDEV